MIPPLVKVALEESGVMEQDIGSPAPPELKIVAAIPIGGLSRDSVAPRMEEDFQVLISPGDFSESLIGPIVEVHPRG